MIFELAVQTKFQAFHVLEEREVRHPHIWRVEVGVTGTPMRGRVVSIPYFRGLIEPVVANLEGTFLNENQSLPHELCADPTCENLAVYFLAAFEAILRGNTDNQIRALKISYLEVAVDELSGEETGRVRLIPLH